MLKLKKGVAAFLGVFLGCIAQNVVQPGRGCAAEFAIPSFASVEFHAATLDMPGTVTIASDGALQQSTGTITVSNNGNWSNSGTFTPGSGIVQFTGTSHAISGSSTFYNLDCQISSGGTVTCQAGQRQTISNTLTLQGASGSYLSLRSSTSGSQWELYPQGTTNINYVDTKDCNNLGSSRIQPSAWTDSGGNSNWGPAPVTETAPTTPVTLSVSSISPTSGATGVAIGATVSATFSLTMNGNTLTTSTFKLSGGGGDVSGAVTTNGATATFTPSSSLAYNTTYTVTITTGAQAANAAGTALSSNYSWSFTTAAESSSGGGGGGGGGTPTPTPTSIVIPITTPTPITGVSPTATPTPTQSADLALSKYTAYLSGDTIIATVTDADRNTSATAADTLTTAIKITADGYSLGGDLALDLVEDGVNSGTFLATLKTGTTTTGGASSGKRSNAGMVKTKQGGTVTVAYTDTTPSASTLAKKLSFSSSDATVAFNDDTYAVGSYALITHVDAEENSDHEKADTLLDHAYIETSFTNKATIKLVETGVDTGTFIGSIQVSDSATLDYERIQASQGETLTVSCVDAINTSNAPRTVKDTASVVGGATGTPTPMATPSPTPATSPTATPVATPTPDACTPTKMKLSARKLEMKTSSKKKVTVTVTGKGGCPVDGQEVTATVSRSGKKKPISVTSSATTDDSGRAVFQIRATANTGNVTVVFRAGSLRSNLSVKVVK